MSAPFVFLDDRQSGQSFYFNDPVRIICARTPAEVPAAFAEIEAARQAGYYVAGYSAYELGYVLEPKLAPLLPQTHNAPLMQFGVFQAPQTAPEISSAEPVISHLHSAWTEAAYEEQFKRVQAYIQAGDVYQINLTFPLFGQFKTASDSLAIYTKLVAAQPVKYGGVIALGGSDIVTLSPELFFERRGEDIRMRPMKGTLKRSGDVEEDRADAEAMTRDPKSQAENLMIVDLLRNDLSRIAKRGSVNVTDLFALETYPTLHQMVSSVSAKIDSSLSFEALMRSLFPCGSVTGAPKIRAMEIIRELESRPRGAYCGAIGYIAPDGDACFNVAIRTLTIDGTRFRYDTGSGVVADSAGYAEYAECLLKAKVLGTDTAPTLQHPDGVKLIETLAFEDGEFRAIARHMGRLQDSCAALDYVYDQDAILAALQGAVTNNSLLRVRLTIAQDGTPAVQTSPLNALPVPLSLALSGRTVNPANMTLAYKTTQRQFYDGERDRLAKKYGVAEAIFLNPFGQIAEGSFTNVFIRKGKRLITPALAAGILPGILRAQLLETGFAEIGTLYPEDLKKNSGVFVGNSLRGLMPAQLNFIESN